MLAVHSNQVVTMNDQHPDLSSFNSTFALDHFAELASSMDVQMFTHLFRPVFGSRLPPALFMHLHKELIAKAFSNPPCQISQDSDLACTYDSQTGLIQVQHDAVARAIDEPAATAPLMIALLGAFALHVQHLLLRGSTALGLPEVETPGAEAVKADFVRTLLFYTKPLTSGGTIATVTEAGTEHQLTLSIPDSSQYRVNRFSAGRGDKNARHSYGHQSIEDGLEAVGFDEAQRQAIYFGNWLRDYSQLIDPKIVQPQENAGVDTAQILQAIISGNLPRVSREKLTAIVDLFGLKAFQALQQTPEGRENYRVTPKMLGVYRAHEHIDNPTTLDREAFDPRSIDPEFTALVLPEHVANKVLPKRSMKRYIRRPLAYMVKQLEAAKKEGMTATGMRLFGEALHVLEDYFAHSNFIELSLRKLGHGEVLVWTPRIESRAESRHDIPVITGMFGALDIVGSVSDPLANLLYTDNDAPPPKAGERSDFDNVMLILLKDEDPFLVKAYELYLNARDGIRGSAAYEWLQGVIQIAEVPSKAVDYASNLIKKPLLKWAGDHIATLQHHLGGDPNQDASIMATHSQLAKDHDTHPFHGLAVLLAALAVRDVGRAMYQHWTSTGTEAGDPREVAERFIVHPNDAEWFEQTVDKWARENPEKVEQGKSLETLRQLQRDELESAFNAIKSRLDEAVKHIEEIEEITDTSYWDVVNLPDTGPAPWSR
ncbi:hypothetical protein F3J45_08685 [Pantoea sp. Ap-967]|nr:hypothetical protein [Pantoea sp. Ap-967]